MDIVRAVEGLGFRVIGRRCDRCRHDWRAHRSLSEELELGEFIRIEVRAGYNATRFVDGDRLVADLCQHCVHQLLSGVLRHLGNDFERPVTDEQRDRADELWFDLLYGTKRPPSDRTH